jgi:hypothetical protein
MLRNVTRGSLTGARLGGFTIVLDVRRCQAGVRAE